MKNEGGREDGLCSKMVSDRGDRCLLNFLCGRRLFFEVPWYFRFLFVQRSL
jgi:hypothetical protein